MKYLGNIKDLEWFGGGAPSGFRAGGLCPDPLPVAQQRPQAGSCGDNPPIFHWKIRGGHELLEHAGAKEFDT